MIPLSSHRRIFSLAPVFFVILMCIVSVVEGDLLGIPAQTIDSILHEKSRAVILHHVIRSTPGGEAVWLTPCPDDVQGGGGPGTICQKITLPGRDSMIFPIHPEEGDRLLIFVNEIPVLNMGFNEIVGEYIHLPPQMPGVHHCRLAIVDSSWDVVATSGQTQFTVPPWIHPFEFPYSMLTPDKVEEKNSNDNNSNKTSSSSNNSAKKEKKVGEEEEFFDEEFEEEEENQGVEFKLDVEAAIEATATIDYQPMDEQLRSRGMHRYIQKTLKEWERENEKLEKQKKKKADETTDAEGFTRNDVIVVISGRGLLDRLPCASARQRANAILGYMEHSLDLLRRNNVSIAWVGAAGGVRSVADTLAGEQQREKVTAATMIAATEILRDSAEDEARAAKAAGGGGKKHINKKKDKKDKKKAKGEKKSSPSIVGEEKVNNNSSNSDPHDAIATGFDPRVLQMIKPEDYVVANDAEFAIGVLLETRRKKKNFTSAPPPVIILCVVPGSMPHVDAAMSVSLVSSAMREFGSSLLVARDATDPLVLKADSVFGIAVTTLDDVLEDIIQLAALQKSGNVLKASTEKSWKDGDLRAKNALQQHLPCAAAAPILMWPWATEDSLAAALDAAESTGCLYPEQGSCCEWASGTGVCDGAYRTASPAQGGNARPVTVTIEAPVHRCCPIDRECVILYTTDDTDPTISPSAQRYFSPVQVVPPAQIWTSYVYPHVEADGSVGGWNRAAKDSKSIFVARAKENEKISKVTTNSSSSLAVVPLAHLSPEHQTSYRYVHITLPYPFSQQPMRHTPRYNGTMGGGVATCARGVGGGGGEEGRFVEGVEVVPIGVHAPSHIVYKLQSHYKRFVGQCCVDASILNYDLFDVVAPLASLRCSELAASSPILRMFSSPWSVDLPIPEGSQLLSIAVTDGGDENRMDMAIWSRAAILTDGGKEEKNDDESVETGHHSAESSVFIQ